MAIFTARHLLAVCAVAQTVKSDDLRRGHKHFIARDLASCAGNEGEWKFALTLDDYPWETSWAIKDPEGDLIAYGPAAGMNYARRGNYEDAGCLSPGDYTLTVKDKSGDGLCCQYGSGKFELIVDDAVVVESDDTKFKRLDFAFTVNAKTEAPSTTRPTNKPTKRPSKKPTEIPSKIPTKRPSPPPTRSPTKKPTIPPTTPWPTYEPTNSPIKTPTKSPTKKPSNAPTSSPTQKPTNPPTETPTDPPTKKPTNPPTEKPTNPPTEKPTDPPTEKPTKPPTEKPTNLPAEKPTNLPTEKPTNLPTEKPTNPPTEKPKKPPTEKPTTSPTKALGKHPSKDPITPPFTSNPTGSPSKAYSEFPSKTESEIPSPIESRFPSVPDSELPSHTQSNVPSQTTDSPSFVTAELPMQYSSQTVNDTVLEYPSEFPSAYPTTSSTAAPSFSSTEISTITLSEIPFPSDDPTEVPSISSLSYPSSSPSRERSIVPITPFSLILSTNERNIDIDELDTILTDHLLQQMQTSLPKSTDLSKVDLLLTDITLIQRSLKKDDEGQGSQAEGGTGPEKQDDTKDNANLAASSAPTPTQVEPTETTKHEISVGGDAYFTGDTVPTKKQLDDITKTSFEGEAGNKFVKNLLSADDPGLQSTVSISVPIDTSDTQLNKGFLLNEQTNTRSSESANKALYIVGVLSAVGLLIVAVFVHRTRQAKQSREEDIEYFAEEIDEEEDHVDLPRYIDVKPVEEVQEANDCGAVQEATVNDCTEGCAFYSFFDAINQAPSQASTEVASNQTSSQDNTRRTLNDSQTLEVANAEDSSNSRSTPSTLYKIEENEEDVGMFCGLNQGHSANKKLADKSRFGLENNWGMKPSESEDTNAIQTRSCSATCN